MNNRVTYTEAVKILAAFLGQNIEVIKPIPNNFRKCQVYRIEYISFDQICHHLIAEGDTWEDVFLKIFPSELYETGKLPDYRGLNFASKIYKYRYIGKAL